MNDGLMAKHHSERRMMTHRMYYGNQSRRMNQIKNLLNILQSKRCLEFRDQSLGRILSEQDIIDNIRKFLRSQYTIRRSILPHRLVILPKVVNGLGHTRG